MAWVFLCLGSFALCFVAFALWNSFRLLMLGGQRALGGPDRDHAALVDEKHAALRTLKDLEFERSLGKISEEDFAALDAQYRARAKAVMAVLDTDIAPYRVEAERLIAARLKQTGK